MQLINVIIKHIGRANINYFPLIDDLVRTLKKGCQLFQMK